MFSKQATKNKLSQRPFADNSLVIDLQICKFSQSFRAIVSFELRNWIIYTNKFCHSSCFWVANMYFFFPLHFDLRLLIRWHRGEFYVVGLTHWNRFTVINITFWMPLWSRFPSCFHCCCCCRHQFVSLHLLPANDDTIFIEFSYFDDTEMTEMSECYFTDKMQTKQKWNMSYRLSHPLLLVNGINSSLINTEQIVQRCHEHYFSSILLIGNIDRSIQVKFPFSSNLNLKCMLLKWKWIHICKWIAFCHFTSNFIFHIAMASLISYFFYTQ